MNKNPETKQKLLKILACGLFLKNPETKQKLLKILACGLFLVFVLFLGACVNPMVGLGKTVDLNPPVPKSSTINNGSYAKGTIPLEGVVRDDKELKAVWAVINGKTVNGSVSADGKYKININTKDPAYGGDGEKHIKVVFQDASGKTTEQKKLLYFDNTPPVMMLTSPAIGHWQSRSTITLKGEAYDPFGVKSVEVKTFDSQNQDAEVSTSKEKGSSTIKCPRGNLGTPDTWIFDITHDSESASDSVDHLGIVLLATDKAGNTSRTVYFYDDLKKVNGGENLTVVNLYNLVNGIASASGTGLIMEHDDFDKTFPASGPDALPSGSGHLKLQYTQGAEALDAIPLKVDMKLDKPVITVIRPEAGDTLGEGAAIYGAVSDNVELDDNRIEIRFLKSDGTIVAPWKTMSSDDGNPGLSGKNVHVVDPRNANFTYPLPPELTDDGDYKVEIKAWDTQKTPKESDVKALVFKFNKALPTIYIDEAANSGDLNNGGSRTVYVKDTNWKVKYSVKSKSPGQVILRIGGDIVAEKDYNSSADFVKDSFDLAAMNPNAIPLNPGRNTLTLSAVNKGTGLSNMDRIMVIKDTSPPTLESISTNYTSETNPNKKIKDKTTLHIKLKDAGGELASVSRQIGKQGPPQELPDDELYNSIISFDTLDYEKAEYADDAGEGIWNLPVTIVAADKAGNRATFTETFPIDNTDNKPRVTIINPQQDGRVNGEVTITGTTTDDDGPVNSVKMRIDLNTPYGGTPNFSDNVTIPNGGSIDFDGTGGEDPVSTINESTWYTVEGTSSWQCVINSGEHLYSTEAGHTGDIYIQIKAIDNTEQKVETSPPATRHFILDGEAPKISITSPAIGSYIKDTAGKIQGTVEDNEAVTIQITLDEGDHWRDVSPPVLDPTTTTGTWEYNFSDWTGEYGAFSEGAIPIQARVTAGGVSSVNNSNVILDTTAPTVEYLTPARGATVNGVVKLKILANDSGGALKSVTRKIGKNGPVETLPPSEMYSSETTIVTTDYQSVTMATETPANSGIWRLPVEVVATDKAGNVTTSHSQYYLPGRRGKIRRQGFRNRHSPG